MRRDASDPVGIPEYQFRSRNHRCLRPTRGASDDSSATWRKRCVIPWSTSRTADFVLWPCAKNRWRIRSIVSSNATIDLIVSGFVLAVVFPVVAIIIWITQRLQSRGPLFHKQVRAGIQNRRFTIYKFRTMRPGDEQIAHPGEGARRPRLSTRAIFPEVQHR